MNHTLARVRERITYANTMSTLAVFIALGGTAWAATALPRNSVGASQIRAGAVRSSEIRNNSVRSADIRDRSIGLRDLSTSARASGRSRRRRTSTRAASAGPAARAPCRSW